MKPARIHRIQDAEEQLRPADAKVFRALNQAAQDRPGAFISMHEIAGLAFGPGERSPSQVKNLVQRSVYEIRQRFGRDAVLNRGPNYRLSLEAFQASPPVPGYVEPLGATHVFGDPFASRIRQILVLAREEEDSTLCRLTFFGAEAVSRLGDASQELGNLLLAGRTVRIVCPDPKQAVDLLKRLATFAQVQGKQLRDCVPLLQVLVTPCPGTAGLGWIDRSEERSFVEISGLQHEPVKVATEIATYEFFKHYDERWNLLKVGSSGVERPVLIDSFDVPTKIQSPEVVSYIQMTGNADLLPLFGNLL